MLVHSTTLHISYKGWTDSVRRIELCLEIIPVESFSMENFKFVPIYGTGTEKSHRWLAINQYFSKCLVYQSKLFVTTVHCIVKSIHSITAIDIFDPITIWVLPLAWLKLKVSFGSPVMKFICECEIIRLSFWSFANSYNVPFAKTTYCISFIYFI